MRGDLHANTKEFVALNTTTIGTNTTTVGNIIDLQGFNTCEFILELGTRTDGVFTPLIEESSNSDMSGSNVVAAANLIGLTTDAALNASNTAKSVGYRVGAKRYVRLSVVSTTVTTGSTGVHAIALLGTPSLTPTT